VHSEPKTYVIDDFPGIFFGISKSKLPPGALVDWGESKGTAGRTYNVQVTNEGELQNAIGYSYVTHFVSAGNPDFGVPNSIFSWSPPQGGSFLFAGTSTGVFLFSMTGLPATTDTTDRALYNLTACLDAASPSWNPTPYLSDTLRKGRFVPYRNSLYYCDGVSYPLRIEYSSAMTAYPMGMFCPGISGVVDIGSVSPSIYYGSSNKVISGGVYYATLLSWFGESPAYILPMEGTSSAVEEAGHVRFNVINLDGWASNMMPPHVYAVNVYRSSQLGDTPRWVTTIKRGQRTYLDTRSDADLGYPIPLEVGLPANFRLMQVFEDRMFGVGGFGSPNRIACSIRGYPDVWPATYELALPDSGKNSVITDMQEINASLYIFMEDRILRLRGTGPENYYFDLVSDYIGCVSSRTMASWNDSKVFLSKRGVYLFNGSRLARISDPIQGLFRENTLGTIGFSNAAGTVVGDQYYLSLNESSSRLGGQSYAGSVTNNRVYSINLANNRVGVKNDGTFIQSCSLGGSESLVLSNEAVLGGTDGQYYSIYLYSNYPGVNLGKWGNYGNDATSMKIFLSDLDFGLPSYHKVLDNVELVYESMSELSFTVTVYKIYPWGDPGTTSETDSVLAGSTPSTNAVWGSTWVSKDYPMSHPRFARASFNDVQGRSFNVGVSVDPKVHECRIQKIIFKYHIDDYTWRGTDGPGVS
jgi:hypothetical protein